MRNSQYVFVCFTEDSVQISERPRRRFNHSALGLGSNVIKEYFPQIQGRIDGLEIELSNYKPVKTYQYKEHARDKMSEKHSMTNSRSKIIHELV